MNCEDSKCSGCPLNEMCNGTDASVKHGSDLKLLVEGSEEEVSLVNNYIVLFIDKRDSVSFRVRGWSRFSPDNEGISAAIAMAGHVLQAAAPYAMIATTGDRARHLERIDVLLLRKLGDLGKALHRMVGG